MTRDVLLARWSEAGAKMLALADALPDDRYDYRPTPAVRTVADQLRHVAFWNLYVGGLLRGEAVDGAANELPRDEYPAKPQILAVLRRSFDEVATDLACRPDVAEAGALETLLPYLEHNGEHYGQLVVYCRLSDVVPPASRT